MLDIQEMISKIHEKQDYNLVLKNIFQMYKNNEISKFDYKNAKKKIIDFCCVNKNFVKTQRKKQQKKNSCNFNFDNDILELSFEIKKLVLDGKSAYAIKTILDEKYSKNLDFTQLNVYIEKCILQ